jgi:hypothetical protein
LHLIPKSKFKDRCPRCNASRYKQNGNSEEVEDDSNKKGKKRQGQKRKNVTPDHDIERSKERKVTALVMWYLPVIDHLKHMFSNPRDAKVLLCHVNHKTDGKIRHPEDHRQWKQFDLAHQEDISNDPRNIRFGLSTDGMSPFREMRNPHSMWLVIMCISIYHHGCATNKSIFY